MSQNRTDVGLCAVAVLAPLVSALVSFRTGNGLWFARAGSLTVLFAAAVQFRLAQQSDAGHRRAQMSLAIGGLPLGGDVSSLQTWLARISLWLMIVGTLVWGYGDLLFGKQP